MPVVDNQQREDAPLDRVDRVIIVATQSGLPLTASPYHEVAQRCGLSAKEVMWRMQRMVERGVIRRIGAVPNHYTLGFRGNGMTVWDVPDERVHELGVLIGGIDFVSHAYHRPRHLPEWRYNLFAMAHGRDRDEVLDKANLLAQLLGEDNRGHEVLFSTRILKKSGLRIAGLEGK